MPSLMVMWHYLPVRRYTKLCLLPKDLNLQHTFIFGEIGEFILGLEIVSENTDSVSLPKFMSFSIIQRSSNNASKSTSPLPVDIHRFPYQCSIWHLLITNSIIAGMVFSSCKFNHLIKILLRNDTRDS